MSVCIITGASAGIGRAVAEQLSLSGYFDKYALPGRDVEAMRETAELMLRNDSSLNVRCYNLDLTLSERIPGVVEEIISEQGDIGCLLNIAGYTDPKPLLSTDLSSMESTYRVNVYAPFLLMRECVRNMKNHGGKILNVASTAGMSSRPGWLSYASSKAALISMSATLTDELAEYGIKVYCVSPGRCATKLRRRLAPDEDPSTIMQPKDVADVIVGLVSPSENCLDGQNIVIRKRQS